LRIGGASRRSLLRLLTLASNPSFVAHEQWPSAMPGETFDAFLAAVPPTHG
jgi:hypothetical protein